MPISERARGAVVILVVCAILSASGRAFAEICGDADDSGSTTVTDGVAMLRAAAGLTSTCADRRCDIDGSGAITVSDGVVALRRAAQLPTAMSCGTRFGELVKTVRFGSIPADLHLETPPDPAANAQDDVVAFDGATQVTAGQAATYVVGLSRQVQSLVLGARENGAFVDGFAEVPIGAAPGSVNLDLEFGTPRADATIDLSVAARSDQLGKFRARTVSVSASGVGGCDAVVRGTIDATVEADRIPLPFTVVEGERLAINVGNDLPSGAGFGVAWRLLTSTGAPAAACGGFLSGLVDCGPLPAAGNPYQIDVQDGFNDATGAYQLHVQRLTASVACEQIPVACDETLASRIDSPVESDLVRLGFSVTDGETLSINVGNDQPSDAGFGVAWRLFAGSGQPAASCGGFLSGLADCGPLPASGNPYQIEVRDGFSDAAGSYRLHVQRPATSGACEATPDCSIDSPGESDLVRFTASDGQVVAINVQNAGAGSPGFGVAWRLFQASGQPAVSCGGFLSGLADCGPLPASGNPYRIEIRDGFSDATGPYVISIGGVVVSCS